ncbi:hypothetical protein BTA51_15745 [Hahella sp. CCB-MM4]|uniref:nucleotidyltransferase family protein n=1 Tax=Hahella sp. (strain CCB-MM4) TaxID=1926491 RepID=UPI000B9A502C|nr:nucleotidyltransferase family protein [Hahella sp. CCB-MM4]OZG72564.1 hypothetical protein BTA51_15745 [Hahella sp. CCB-MM4]
MGWLILCAGQSSRFGSNKLLARLDNGRILLEQTLDHLVATGIPVFAVCRQDTPEVYEILERKGLEYGIAPQAQQGMGHSLAWGITQVVSWNWAGIVLADMPFIDVSTLKRLASVADAGNIILPEYQEADGLARAGHPVIFGHSFFKAIQTLQGDRGARSLLERYADSVIRQPVGDAGVLLDIDTPGDIPRE